KGRQRLVTWLSRLTSGAWYRLGDLLETIKRRDPMILRSRPEVIRFLGYHGLEQLMRDWEAGDGAAPVQVPTQPLHWLGAVDVGSDDGGVPVAIRLNELGRWLIGEPAAPAPAPSPEPPLVVQPNFEVVALELDGPILYRLSRFAELQRADRVATFA